MHGKINKMKYSDCQIFKMIYLNTTVITPHLLSKFNKQDERKCIIITLPAVDPFKS